MEYLLFRMAGIASIVNLRFHLLKMSWITIITNINKMVTFYTNKLNKGMINIIIPQQLLITIN